MNYVRGFLVGLARGSAAVAAVAMIALLIVIILLIAITLRILGVR